MKKPLSSLVSAALAVVTALVLLCAPSVRAAELKGKVQFGGLPVPGATVTAKQGDKTLTAVASDDGQYRFADIAPGAWNFQVDMLCFETLKQDVTVAEGAGPDFELKMLPLDQIKSFAATQAPEPPRISVTQNTAPAAGDNSKNAKNDKNTKNQKAAANAPAANTQSSFQRAQVNANPNADAPQSAAADAVPPANSAFAGQSQADLNQRATDALAINGSVNNGASTPFAQAARFGNNVRGFGSLYNGGVALTFDTSSLDARNYSFTGQDTAKPSFTHLTGNAQIGGPIRIPHIIRNGGQFFVNYTWTRNRTSSTLPGLMPTDAQRNGDFSSSLSPIYDPLTGAPFAGNQIPTSRFSPQALDLLKLFPEPNLTGSTRYNYQIPLVGAQHNEGLQSRINKNIGNKNQLIGNFAFQRTVADNPNLFNFLDRSQTFGMILGVNWQHRLSQRMFMHVGVTFSRQSVTSTPYFANRENVAEEDSITGTNQDPRNFGPPTLAFNGITSLSDGNYSVNHNQSTQYTFDSTWNRGRHSFNYGGDFTRLQSNQFGQSNPRGQFIFTGAATTPPGSTQPGGSDFADFLLGTPDTAAIAYGNADKYFRQSLWDAFVTDDWRVGPALSMKLGVRWEYMAPVTEKYGRLVNLDIASGYTNAQPVVANNPVGPLTNQKYADSLIQPDKTAFQPRVGLAWRPIPASSLIVRLGYGVYYNTSVYQTIAQQMAQQAPLSKSLLVQNSAATPLTLANGFYTQPGVLSNTFAIDPKFRVGYAQNFQASVQRDLPGSLVVIATYLGIKGTRGPQEFVPNTYPAGSVNVPCLSCPTGFYYMTSNGNSTRQSGQLQLRRRLHNGFTANVSYTFAKAIDDSSLGGRGQGTTVVAQNWLDLSAERGLSTFDQRHLVSFQLQYTTGQGIAGGTLLSGWRATAFREWTIVSTVNAGTGFPLSPSLTTAIARTGITGAVRPDYTGQPLYVNEPGVFLNSAAYAAPPNGQWGNAGRDSITGPSQFTLNTSLRRSFRLRDRYTLDVNVDATNLLNHVNYTSWVTVANSPLFGSAAAASGMRSLSTTLRVRF